LDEISETSLAFQVKLLRVLQEHQIRRLGSTTCVPIDVRIVAATNRDPKELIQKGQFREDLYYRLGVVTIQLPSLEERRDDIPLLVRHFLSRFNQRNQGRVVIAEQAVRQLVALPWSGNVRELENTVERLAIFCTSNAITPEDMEALTAPETVAAVAGSAQQLPPATLVEMERQHILRALREAEGNKSLAARRLGIERKSLYKKARRLGLDLETKEWSSGARNTEL
jgi:DNA-binding NtrC family response regulator